MRHRLSEESW